MGIHVQDLGILPFDEAHAHQQRMVAERLQGGIPDTLVLLEHPLVLTLGRGTHRENLLATEHIPTLEVERGGDATLHMPGQVVGYLIRELPEGQRDLRAHLRLCEQIVMDAIAPLGLTGGRVHKKTGVWIDGSRKIASIGIACRRWVTWHGFALNVCNDLSTFQAINPCGLSAAVMTSLSTELGRNIEIIAAKQLLTTSAQALMG